jgi:hemerythrin superfamily protein
MDLWQFISNDHENVAELMRRTLDTGADDASSRDKLFQQVRQALELHARTEEEVFYPVLRQYDATSDMVDDAIEEHQEIKDLLEALSSGDKNGEAWTDQFKDLQELVEDHVAEEEEEIFPAAQEAFEPAEAQSLLRRMEQIKQQAPRPSS